MMIKYATIIADPPWEYKSPRALVGCIKKDGTPSIQVDVSSQYPTMSLNELEHLQVPSADNCVMFMWVTNPFLCDGSGAMIIKAWGFTPKTVLTWAKVKSGTRDDPSMKTGHWFRSASEHVIFAVKGDVRRPENFPALATWFPAERLPHSVKPDLIHRYAELCCRAPRLEMFARRKREGWDTWGNDPSLT